jgi:hypothetical protein
MTKTFSRMLLCWGLLSCTSSGGGGGGGGLGDNAGTTATYASTECMAALRCKDSAWGRQELAQIGNPTDQLTCEANLKTALMQANGDATPCGPNKMLDAIAAQACLSKLNAVVCATPGDVDQACATATVCKPKVAGGGQGGSGFPGQGGSIGGGQGGFGQPPGQGGSSGGNACANCLQSSCGQQLAACQANAQCAQLFGCVAECQDETCENNCVNQFPGGVQTLNAFLQCGLSACNAACQ